MKTIEKNLSWLILTFTFIGATARKLDPSDYPRQIHLKAGTFDAPPMIYVQEDDNGNPTFSGLQPDLIEKLQEYAKDDGVDLQIDLMIAPPQYNGAFDFIANDCNTTENPLDLADCQKFDLLVNDYWSNPDRYTRADFTPSWMRTTGSTMKHIEKPEGSQDFTTLAEADQARAAVCVQAGAYVATVVESKFPDIKYVECEASGDGNCLDRLKRGDCVLYAHDELLLYHIVMTDPSLEVTRESFSTQYIVWPLSESLPPEVSWLLNKWVYRAVQTGAMDDLYFKYFKRERCPHGTAGTECELPCDPDHGTADSKGKCVCESARWTGDDCSIMVPEELNMLPSSIVLFAYTLAGINFMLVSLCGLWLFWNRNRSQVKIAQPIFLVIILVGCLISSSTIFAMVQESEGDGPVHSCQLIPWLYSVGFSLTFGALFARIRRIYELLNSALQMKRLLVSTKDTLMTVAMVLTMDVSILAVWTIINPLEWRRVVTNVSVLGESLESKGYCHSEYWMVFAGLIAIVHCLLMAVACYMCYLARKLPERISNGKFVAIAMFSNFQIFVIVIPILIMLGSSNPPASFFIRSAAIWINDFVVVLLIFGDLILKVYKLDRNAAASANRNTQRTEVLSHAEICKDIRAYSKKMGSTKSAPPAHALVSTRSTGALALSSSFPLSMHNPQQVAIQEEWQAKKCGKNEVESMPVEVWFVGDPQLESLESSIRSRRSVTESTDVSCQQDHDDMALIPDVDVEMNSDSTHCKGRPLLTKAHGDKEERARGCKNEEGMTIINQGYERKVLFAQAACHTAVPVCDNEVGPMRGAGDAATKERYKAAMLFLRHSLHNTARNALCNDVATTAGGAMPGDDGMMPL